MPFRSEKQRRYMFMHHPEIAHRWAHKYGSKPQPKHKLIGDMPKHHKKKRRKK